MALISCPECGREISDKAPACPHCGAPTKVADKNEEERKKARTKQRANTQGFGCLLIIIGVILAAVTGGVGGIVAAVGLIVLIYGLVMSRS